MLDNFDEELELEFDDHRLEAALGELGGDRPKDSSIAAPISGNCCGCRRELIKLQDWVVHQKLKLMVLFEGRDAAGKGGGSSASPSGSIRGFAKLLR